MFPRGRMRTLPVMIGQLFMLTHYLMVASHQCKLARLGQLLFLANRG